MYVDTHCHIFTAEFDTDRDAVLNRARAAGAARLLLPCIDAASVLPMLRLRAAAPDLCVPMLGLHPTELPPDPSEQLSWMERQLSAPGHPYAAIGEVGIDLHWDTTRRDEQAAVLRTQAGWAAHWRLPLIVHSRDAHADILRTLQPLAARLTGIFHCFSGTADEARQLLQTFPRFCLGIGGTVTYRRSTLPAVLRQAVPLDRIVLETDSPYLPPQPLRGQRNEPAYVPLVAARLAQTYDVPVSEVYARTNAAVRRLFPHLGLPGEDDAPRPAPHSLKEENAPAAPHGRG